MLKHSIASPTPYYDFMITKIKSLLQRETRVLQLQTLLQVVYVWT